ncbi:MAG: hypothetical protein E7J78_12515, partial [Pantoea sp.]|nr:hypothetical protein [Pantoea sp.]
MQFAVYCLDWSDSTKGKVRRLPQCGAIALCIHGMARYNRYVRHSSDHVFTGGALKFLYIEGSINARNDDGKMMKNGLLKLVL